MDANVATTTSERRRASESTGSCNTPEKMSMSSHAACRTIGMQILTMICKLPRPSRRQCPGLVIAPRRAPHFEPSSAQLFSRSTPSALECTAALQVPGSGAHAERLDCQPCSAAQSYPSVHLGWSVPGRLGVRPNFACASHQQRPSSGHSARSLTRSSQQLPNFACA